MTLYVSPWSPPAFMKDNNNLCWKAVNFLQEYKQSWADYYVKFIKAYEEEQDTNLGTDRTKRTHGYTKMGDIYTTEDERDLSSNSLGQHSEKSGLQEKKLIAWDHNRDLMYQRVHLA